MYQNDTFLVPAHLCSPEKRTVKRVCMCACVCECILLHSMHTMYVIYAGIRQPAQREQCPF